MPPGSEPLVLPPGNEALRARLVALAHAERLHHCMLFEGPEGLGKAATARWLAMLVNCEAEAGPSLFGPPPPRTSPCGACWSCRRIAGGEHPDVIAVEPEADKANPVIGVKQARDLLGALSLHAFHARRRFVLIDPADALTAEAANALLKTLEEPPRATSFVLVTARASTLLPTVRSRCQRLRFAPAPAPAVQAWLEAAGLPDGALLAVLSEGRPLRAQALAEGELQAWRQVRDELVRVLDEGTGERLAWAEKLARGERAEVRARVDRLLDVVGCLVRDGLVAGAPTPGARGLYHADRPELAGRWGQALGLPGACRVQLALDEARQALDANAQVRLVLDAFLARLRVELGPRA